MQETQPERWPSFSRWQWDKMDSKVSRGVVSGVVPEPVLLLLLFVVPRKTAKHALFACPVLLPPAHE
jgi:hypothetical protein